MDRHGTAGKVSGESARVKPEVAGEPPKNVSKGAKNGTYATGREVHPIRQSAPFYGSGKVSKPYSPEAGSGREDQKGSVMERSVSRPENHLTSLEKMDVTRKGISKRELEQLKKGAGLYYDKLSHILQVARATLIAKKGSEKFPPLLSEKIMSLADIYSYGYGVFGAEDEFNKWIFQPIAALGGKSPYEILDNQHGREEVRHIIGRIEYGVYS